MPLIPYVVREHHEELGHSGVDTLKIELDRLFVLDVDTARLKALIPRIVKHCVNCHENTHTKLRRTPVLNRRGDSFSGGYLPNAKKAV